MPFELLALDRRLILRRSMGPDAALNLEVAAVVAVAVLIVAVAVFAWGACACDGDAGTAVRVGVDVDVELALGEGTLMTYEQAAKKASLLPTPPPEEEQCCAICLSKYAKADELVRVVAACGHFFHAECGVDRWLRTRRTCPVCRGGLWPPLPRLPRPECPPRGSSAAVAVAVV